MLFLGSPNGSKTVPRESESITHPTLARKIPLEDNQVYQACTNRSKDCLSEVRAEARLSLRSPRLSLESLSEHKALLQKSEQKQDCPSEVRAEAKLSLRSPRLSSESLKQDCPSEVRAEAKLSLRSPRLSPEGLNSNTANIRLSLRSPRLSPESLNSNTHSTSARKTLEARIDGSNGCSSEVRMKVHFYCVKKTPFRREMTPSSELSTDKDELESSTVTKPSSAASLLRRKHPVAKMPSAAEIEEFFSTAEKLEQKLFADKYNYDIKKDLPKEGRYQWVRLKP